jgi:hypothetical protein
VQQFNEWAFRKIPGLRDIWRRGVAAALETFSDPRSGQATSLFNSNAQACAGPLIPKIQFNGIGGLLTYISLTPNADVSASGSYGEVCIAPPPPPTCIAPP